MFSLLASLQVYEELKAWFWRKICDQRRINPDYSRSSDTGRDSLQSRDRQGAGDCGSRRCRTEESECLLTRPALYARLLIWPTVFMNNPGCLSLQRGEKGFNSQRFCYNRFQSEEKQGSPQRIISILACASDSNRSLGSADNEYVLLPVRINRRWPWIQVSGIFLPSACAI